MPLDTNYIPSIISGVLTTISAAAIIGLCAYIRKGIKDRMAMKQQLNQILEGVTVTKNEQLAQRKDMKLLFELMGALLAGSQLTAKSLRQVQFEDEAPFNGDLKAASELIDTSVKKLKDYLDDKAFPYCEDKE